MNSTSPQIRWSGVNTIENLLIARATGDMTVSMRDYERLRRELIADPQTQSLLPLLCGRAGHWTYFGRSSRRRQDRMPNRGRSSATRSRRSSIIWRARAISFPMRFSRSMPKACMPYGRRLSAVGTRIRKDHYGRKNVKPSSRNASLAVNTAGAIARFSSKRIRNYNPRNPDQSYCALCALHELKFGKWVFWVKLRQDGVRSVVSPPRPPAADNIS